MQAGARAALALANVNGSEREAGPPIGPAAAPCNGPGKAIARDVCGQGVGKVLPGSDLVP